MWIFAAVCLLVVVGSLTAIPVLIFRYSRKLKLRALDQAENVYRDTHTAKAEEREEVDALV